MADSEIPRNNSERNMQDAYEEEWSDWSEIDVQDLVLESAGVENEVTADTAVDVTAANMSNSTADKSSDVPEDAKADVTADKTTNSTADKSSDVANDATSDVTADKTTNSTADKSSDVANDTTSDVTADKTTNSTADKSSDVANDATSDVTADKTTNSTADKSSDVANDATSDVTADKMTNSTADKSSDVANDTTSDVTADKTTNSTADKSSDVANDTTSDVTADKTTNSTADKSSDVANDATSDVTADKTTNSTADKSSDVANDTTSDVTADKTTNSTADKSSDVANDATSDVTADKTTNSTADKSSDVATDTTSDVTADKTTHSTADKLSDVANDTTSDVTADKMINSTADKSLDVTGNATTNVRVDKSADAMTDNTDVTADKASDIVDNTASDATETTAASPDITADTITAHDVTDDICLDIPLIHFTKNKRLLLKDKINRIKQKSLKRNEGRKIQSAGIKKAPNTTFCDKRKKRSLENEMKETVKIAKSTYSLGRRKKTYKNVPSPDELDDSGDDETYKPNFKDLSASDSETSQPEQNSAKIRDKNWKRKGKHIKERGTKKRRIVHVDANAEKQHKSGPWKINQQAKSIPSPSLKKARELSKKEYTNRQIVLRYHTRRLDNLLLSNGFKRIPVYPDGNCFLNALLSQINSDFDTATLREELVKHLRSNREHYLGFLQFPHSASLDEKIRKYETTVNELNQDGQWNNALADFVPLAFANIFKSPIRIYSSNIENSVYDVKPDLVQIENDVIPSIRVALFCIPGHEHYDRVEVLLPHENSPMKPSEMSTPKSKSSSARRRLLSPRKRAKYKSPVKKQLFRKKKREPSKWKRNQRKHNRDHGLPYTGAKGKNVSKKSAKYKNCEKCRFKCNDKISRELADEICKMYYELGDYRVQRNFICKCVLQSEPQRVKTNRKKTTKEYYLPVNGKNVRVCKSFFLGTLDIGKKTVDSALKKKCHSMFVGADNRGKKTPVNKTPEADREFIRQHIQSFPTVDSHYTRKDTNRKYLSPNLSTRKMFDLYVEKCQSEGRKACKINVYRKIFCTEFNLSFHKPKKDQCLICSVYQEKKASDKVTPEEEEKYSQHIQNKERSRAEKQKDKERAQDDKSFVVSTFDLEAVLPTPYSKVGDVYYKRCLSTYNLSVYSLGDKKGTCFLWDETNGARGSCEIGTCLLLHINSITAKSPRVKEITYYSDTCGGQNRNQFVASAFLYALNKHQELEKINHKFFEKGHSEMECDSIHAAIERAKQNTSVYVPCQWDTIVLNARKKNPYIIIPLCHEDFMDLKTLQKTVCKNTKTSVQGSKVNWLQVKWIQVSKSSPSSIFLNYTFHMDQFIEVNARSSLRGRMPAICNFTMPPLYSDKLKISSAKKTDLLSMCRSGLIPRPYHSFYENLRVNADIKDKLPEPDITEEDQDTDNES